MGTFTYFIKSGAGVNNPFFDYLIMACITIRQVGMADILHMPGQARICYSICITEYLAKWPDPIALKHLDIHALADIVFNLFFAEFKMIISDASIFYPVFMVRFIPFTYNCKTKRKTLSLSF